MCVRSVNPSSDPKTPRTSPLPSCWILTSLVLPCCFLQHRWAPSHQHHLPCCFFGSLCWPWVLASVPPFILWFVSAWDQPYTISAPNAEMHLKCIFNAFKKASLKCSCFEIFLSGLHFYFFVSVTEVFHILGSVCLFYFVQGHKPKDRFSSWTYLKVNRPEKN